MLTPSASLEASRAVGAHGSGDHPRPGAGDPEAGALLVDEVHDPDGSEGLPALGPRLRLEQVEGGEGAHHAQRAVEGSAVGNAVEVGAGHDPLLAAGGGGIGVAPPRPLVAHAVLGQVEAAGRALAGEPLAQVVVLIGPGETAVAAGAGVAAHRLECSPHRLEAHSSDSSRLVSSAMRERAAGRFRSLGDRSPRHPTAEDRRGRAAKGRNRLGSEKRGSRARLVHRRAARRHAIHRPGFAVADLSAFVRQLPCAPTLFACSRGWWAVGGRALGLFSWRGP